MNLINDKTNSLQRRRCKIPEGMYNLCAFHDLCELLMMLSPLGHGDDHEKCLHEYKLETKCLVFCCI